MIFDKDKIEAHTATKKAEYKYKKEKKKEWQGWNIIDYIKIIIFYPLFVIPITWFILPKSTVRYWMLVLVVFCGEEYLEAHVDDVMMFTKIIASEYKKIKEKEKEDN